MPAMNTWVPIHDDLRVLEYSFGPGPSNAFAFRGREGWVVMSPPCKVDDSAYEGFDGGVTALVATNGFHHLGLRPWKERFPNATLHAHTKAAKRIAKKQKGLVLDSLDALNEKLPEGTQVVATPHLRTPDGHVFVSTDAGTYWYTGDTIGNSALPKNLLFGWLFKATNSGPGYKVNHLILKILGAKKPLLKKWMLERIEAHPLAGVIPGHGDTVLEADAHTRTQHLLETEI